MSDWKLISTANPSGSTSTSFTDLTGYNIFKFVFIDINPATDAAEFQFQCSIDGGSNYNVTTTTTYFSAVHFEADSYSALTYQATMDQSQGTGFQDIGHGLGNQADACFAGELNLFNPSSTTYVKHFFAEGQHLETSSGASYPQSSNSFVAGYFNDTNDINGISFKMSSGNFSGTIKQYGLAAV
tara:strand:+ start:69 stop:620 length:552 start_codon:yes stop_codon:yes gene_type:complete